MEQSRNFIYSGSNDFLVIEWDVLTNEISRRFTGHSNDVRCLCVARGCLFSGSDDLSIQVSCLISPHRAETAWQDTECCFLCSF